MFGKEKAQKFGYQEIIPYTELLHAVGLLHTARKVDANFALSQVKKILSQKYDSFCIGIVYDSSKEGKDVAIGKVFKAGNQGFSKRIKKSLPVSRIEFDSDINATIIEAAGSKKGLFILKNSIVFNALCCHFKMVLLYDVTRNSYEMFYRPSKRQGRDT